MCNPAAGASTELSPVQNELEVGIRLLCKMTVLERQEV